MDISDPSSINSSDLDTMGSILAASNENNAQADETDQAEGESSLTNVEVIECQTEKILDIPADIDLLSLSKSSDSVIEQDVLPQTSSSVDNLNISESDCNVEDLWLASDTRELVKVETDEDFDVIVKSLETAIVGADKVPILSPILVPQSSVESDVCDPVLLESLPSISELEVETSKLQNEQCLESLIDTSIITSEFAAISGETFDEQSTNLFENTDAVTELTNIDSRPSLLELQETDMTCDIAEAIHKDVLPIIKGTLLNEDSLDSAEDILNNIVNRNIDSEVQIEEAVDEEIVEFPETQDIDENATEMLNKSIDTDQQPLTEKSVEIGGQEIGGKREEMHSEINATEENVDKSEEYVDEVTKTDKSDSECEKVLAKNEEIMVKHEAMSDIDIVNMESLTDVDIFDKTEEIIENEVDIPLKMTQENEPEDNSSEIKRGEEIMKDLAPDREENINSVALELTESVVVSSESEIKTETQGVQAEISETSIEQLPGKENQQTLSVTLENVRLENVSIGLAENLNKIRVVLEENIDKVRVVLEESADNSSVKVDENITSVIVEESVDCSRVNRDDNKLLLTAEEDITVTPDKCAISLEQMRTVSDISQVTSVKPNTESQLDEPKPTATIDKPKDNENNHTSTSSSDTQSSIVEDQVKHTSDTVEKEQSPPKKIKLIREKLYIPPVNISTVLPSVDTPTNVAAKVVSSENVTEQDNSENVKIISAETIEDVCDQQFAEKTSPVRSRKLKLNRDYEPEHIVSRQSEDCVTKDTEEIPSVVSEEESVKPTSSATISDSVTVQCESQNIIEEPKVEQGLKADEEIDQEIKMVSETDLKTDEEIQVVSETGLKSDEEIDTAVNISIEKDIQMIAESIKSAETTLDEVKLESLSELSDAKQVEVPEDDTITNEMPGTCAIDVPTALDNDIPITEDIPEAADAENTSKSPEPVPDCEETSAGILSNSPEQTNSEESPENSRKSPESLPHCEETPVGILSNSPEQTNPEESPENSPKSPESLPDCEETPAGIISNSPEQANPEESPENSLKSPEPVPDYEETPAGIIFNSGEQINPEEIPSTILVTSTEVLPEKIVEESVVICEEKSSGTEEKSSGTEETTSVAPETISLPAATKLSILQQMLMKDVVVPIKEKSGSSSVVDLPSVEPIKEFATPIVRGETDLATERAEEATIEDELLQAAKAVETRIDANEENDDELKQAAQEAETRDEHAEAPLEATEAEFEDNSVNICEDEIIAVTQALEMERAQENLVEISKTESLLEICKEKPVMLDTECQPSLVATFRQEIASKGTLIVEQIQDKVHAKLDKIEDNKLKRHIEETATISAVAAKKTKSNKDSETTIGRKQKSSPVTEDSIDAIEVAAKQSVTIEPVSSSHSGAESVGKLRISRRKLEEPGLGKSVTITKPLRVEVDDLGNSSMSPSYFSDLPPQRDVENVPKIVIKPIPKPEERSSPKITIKPILKPSEMVLSPKISKSKSSDDACTPRITIKPILKPDPLKITITKQKMDDTHSILKIYKPDEGMNQFDEKNIPKLTIKPIVKCDDMQHSPRITIKPVKPPNQHSPSTSMSPKITVKPVMPPNDQSRLEISHSPKITVKSVQNPEDSYPKVTIKPILRPDDSPRGPMSPRQVKLKTMTFESSSGVTVEPIAPVLQNADTQMTPLKISVKSFAKIEETLSPKLTIKPITKTCEIVQSEDGSSNPLKLTIKPILKSEESYQSPKITIKPIMKPEKLDQGVEEMDKPERIILKIQKTNLPSPKERAAHSKESRKEPEVKIEAILQDPDRNQKLDKIKLKLTKEGSHAQIIPSVPSMLTEQFTLKRPLLFSESSISEKRSKSEFSGTELLHNSDISINLVEPNAKPNPKTISEEVTIVKLDRSSGSVASPLAEHISQSKFKEMLLKIQQKADITCTPHIEDNSSSSDDVKIVGVGILASNSLKDPLSIHDESSSQDVVIVNEVINTNPFQNVQIINAHTITEASAQQTPKKRGRPRKNPLEVKPEIKGEDCVEIVRPKRTCRAPPGRTPFAVKERKPRGAGRGRGGRGRGGASPKSPKEPKTPRGKALKEAKALAKLEAAKLAQEVVIDEIIIEDSTNDTLIATPVPPVEDVAKKPLDDQEMAETEVKLSQVSEELLKEPQHLPPPIAAVYEEETRMSADNSRAQTPARQVIAAPQLEGPEESQSSVHSSATTESNKNKKGRLEVCDPDSAVTTVEQIVEYTWGPGGTYMLQEQIAQFLGVKSFKRKYPGLTRRPVEMQERDYIREKGLVSESMCDMGLTAVPSSEILDIMYTDFQEKYEEYRKCMRDKQSKEISNKQKAISLATSQEKNKIDFKERAIRSAANWNVNFNKSRKESRRCCMDLQTFTINFPLGRTQCKVPQKSPVGQYPIALVPGQFTDYYKRYTSNELHYLPLNTVRYGPVMPNQHCTDAGQSDGSQSDTDSSSGSDSDSSDDSMSTVEETPANAGFGKAGLNLSLATPKAKVH